MALTGERLRQLLHANEVRRNKKRRSNRHTGVTTGEDEEDDDEEEAQPEADRDRKSLESGQYIACHVVASRGRLGNEKWMKPFSGQGEPHKTATSDPSQSTTYTACVTEDLAFRKLRPQELPSTIRRPRSASLSIYVLDDDLTQWIASRDSRDHSKRSSKRLVETLVPRRKRSARDDAYYGLDYHDALSSVPPIPPKPGNISVQTPSLSYKRYREHGQSSDDERQPDPSPNRSPRPLPTTPQEPALPLPPRKNRPAPSSAASTRQNGYPSPVAVRNAIGPHELKDSVAILEPEGHEYDDADHYEALDSKIPEANEAAEETVQGTASSSGKGSTDTASIDERCDSVFDKSNDLSYTGSSSDLDAGRTVPPYAAVSNQECNVKPPRSPAPRVPLSQLRRGTSILPARPEIALPKMSRGRHDDSDSSGTDTYEPIDVRDDLFDADGPPSLYRADPDDTSGPSDSSWLLIRRDDIVIVETAAVYNAPLALSETESDDDMGLHLRPSNDSHDERPHSDSLAAFLCTSLCYDKDGNAIYAPADRLKPYGDPRGQPWFYPIDLSSREATLFLRGEQQEGCFLVYRPSPNSGATTAAYNLSVSRGNGDVLHYHILEGPEGGVTVEGHDHSFLNLADLVDYFRRNKSTLATRLRRPLKEARLPVTAGYHYDLAFELDRDRLSLSGSIIGKGNFGVVCSGTYGTTQVAVKVLQGGTETSLEEEDDFIEEARILMLLRHEHVVRIIGVSSSARPFFLVNEFIRNGNLKECLRAGRIQTNNPEILLSICLQMLDALTYLEAVKVVLHRDVAARNFLVVDHKCIKLADFGRARYVSDDNYQAPRTEKISIKWAAPEVLVDFRYSTKSDVWAAGVAMWEVYSVGERPYESLSAEQTAVYVTEGGRLARPSLCPEEMYSAVRRCWRRSPSCRPSAADLHQTIVENRRAAIYRRNQKSSSVGDSPIITVSVAPRPSVNPPTTPVMAKKMLKNGGTRSGKQRFSSLRDALTYVSNKDGDQSMKKTNSNERLPHSSSSDNVSLPSTPDPTASQRIRSSFRKLIITKKIRNNSKSKADYLKNDGKPSTITEL